MKPGIAACVFAVLFTWSCGTPRGPLEPVPTVTLDGVDPDVRDAVLAAHRQAEAEPEDAAASGRLGMVLQANAFYPEAVLAYERAVWLDPDEFAWRYYLATTLQQQSELEKAADTLAEALRIRPDYVPARIKQGELLFELGRLEESSDALASLLDEDSTSAQAQFDLARVKYQQGDFPAAEDLYRKAIAAYPTFGPAYYGLALTEKRLGREEDADKHFELAEQYRDDKPPVEDLLIDEMWDLRTGLLSKVDHAQQLFAQGDSQEASRLLQEVLQQDPENLDSLLNVLYLGADAGQLSAKQMEAFYDRARRIAPRNSKVYLYYANVLNDDGKHDAAIAALNKAIDLKPDDPESQTLMGIVLEEKNRPSEAIAHYRRALAIDPSHRRARVQLAKLLVNLGRYPEAIPELRKVIEVDDASTSPALLFLAEAYSETGDVDRALEYLQHARTRAQRTGPPELLQQIEEGLRQLGSRRR